MQFYQEASKFKNTTININFYDLTWIDANLSALLYAILYKLTLYNNLYFTTDANYVKGKFDILFKNGFFHFHPINDKYATTVPLAIFTTKEKESFVNYIKVDLLGHKAICAMAEDLKNGLKNSFLELFSNIDLHAQTIHPLFACGQFFPSKKILRFTFLDLGVGYLENIRRHTRGLIQTHEDAIRWAVIEGNSTKEDGTPGGLGLSEIYRHCCKYNGILHIASGDAYWGSDIGTLEYIRIPNPLDATVISLCFSC